MLGRLFGAILHKLDSVRSAPLPERAFSALGLKCIPLFQILFRCEKFFETPVGSAVAKAGLHVRIPMGQSFLRELERESLAKVEIVLVRNQDIAIGGFQIVRKTLVIDRARFGDPINRAGVQRTKARCSNGAAKLTKSNAADRSSYLTITISRCHSA